jgi:translation initiation factor IF-3
MSKPQQRQQGTIINEGIRFPELRVIDDELGNLGVMSRDEAIAKAQARGLDLILFSAEANPPIAKIIDYGKYQYQSKKRDRDIRAKAKASMVEVKNIQIKIGTGENDLRLKALKASSWLSENHRVKVELFLKGRSKALDKEFLGDRVERFLAFLKTPYIVVEDLKQVPKGFALILERDKKVKLEVKEIEAINQELIDSGISLEENESELQENIETGE